MNANEIAKALREECNDCSERYSCEAGHSLLYCPNREAADLITSQQSEIDRLTALNKEAVELVGLATDNMSGICYLCANANPYDGLMMSCKYLRSRGIIASTKHPKCMHFVWQQADRYEKLGVKV